MKKTIAIYFSDQEPMGYPFDKPEYFEKYQEIIAEIEKQGIEVFIVRGDSYIGKGKFKKGYKFVNGQLKESIGEIKSDLIFNRDDKNTIPVITDCKIINNPRLDQFCLDKLETSQIFSEISPKTASVNSFKECLENINNWQLKKQDRVVLKSNFETEGRGVYIIPVSEVKQDLYDDWSDVLIQEFLDSSVGISDIVEGRHDLRVNVVNGLPVNSYVRQPAAGGYLANVAQGGQGESVDLEKVPTEVMKQVEVINEKLGKYFPAVYSADFMNSSKGYKLIELNSRPAIQHPSWSKHYQKFNGAVAQMLIRAVNQ